MKILFVHNRYQQKGGEDTVLEAEMSLMESYGHSVILAVQDNKIIDSKISKAKLFYSVTYSSKSKSWMRDKICSHKPDIVHVHNFFPLISSSIYDACIEARVPVIQTLHNYRMICPGALLMRNGKVCEKCITGSPYNAVLHGCYKGSRVGSLAVARMVDYHRSRNTWQEKVGRFITLTEFSKQKFVHAGFPSNKISVKSNFTSHETGNFELIVNNELQALFVGRLSHEKGVATLLSAWGKISLPLHIVGDGPLYAKAQNSGLNTVVVFGRLTSDEVSLKMSKASFLVMPSKWYEGFPMVLVEAFSHGLPVIASRLGSMAEIVEDGVTGLHFEAGNSDDLVEKVLWMQSHPEKCQEMGENARRVYLEKYTPEINYKILIQIYQEVIDEYK